MAKAKNQEKTQKMETKRDVPASTLIQQYKNDIVPKLKKQFSFTSVMQVPRIQKIVINRGVGEATVDTKALESSLDEMYTITDQKPVVKKAKKSVANFKLRAGQPVGTMVTLRGRRMYAFLEKLINEALPRIRDFRGLNPNSFDGRGNYTFGIREQLIFAEIDYNKVDKVRGFNVSIITNAPTDEIGKALLEAFSFPFRKDKN